MRIISQSYWYDIDHSYLLITHRCQLTLKRLTTNLVVAYPGYSPTEATGATGAQPFGWQLSVRIFANRPIGIQDVKSRVIIFGFKQHTVKFLESCRDSMLLPGCHLLLQTPMIKLYTSRWLQVVVRLQPTNPPTTPHLLGPHLAAGTARCIPHGWVSWGQLRQQKVVGRVIFAQHSGY